MMSGRVCPGFSETSCRAPSTGSRRIRSVGGPARPWRIPRLDRGGSCSGREVEEPEDGTGSVSPHRRRRFVFPRALRDADDPLPGNRAPPEHATAACGGAQGPSLRSWRTGIRAGLSESGCGRGIRSEGLTRIGVAESTDPEPKGVVRRVVDGFSKDLAGQSKWLVFSFLIQRRNRKFTNPEHFS